MHLSGWLVLGMALVVRFSSVPAEAQADRRVVDNLDSLRREAARARPGTQILLAPGEYTGGLSLLGIAGDSGRPVVLRSSDPKRPATFVRGGIQLSRVAHLEVRDLHIVGSSTNGLNVDDGGRPDSPSHHVLISGLVVRDTGPQGNRDGIKLSGLDDFTVDRCTVERWGSGGSAVDMVGCRRGRITRCTFKQGGSNGVQAKGGSEAIEISGNLFESCGERAVNAGGSTGLPYFRPKPQGFEARAIRVENNVFRGGACAVAFVGVDGAVVRNNTLWQPERWAFRILQETRLPEFVPSRNGVIEANIIVFRSDTWREGGLNIGPGTAPETFRFSKNAWYCIDRPDRSQPKLPTPETGAVVGQDPRFVNPTGGDFRLQPDSPAVGRGASTVVGQ